MNTVTTHGSPRNDSGIRGTPVFSTVPIQINLPEHVMRLQRSTDYLEQGRIAGALVLRSELRLVVVALRAGVRIPAHDTTQRITVQGLQGRVRFHCTGDTIELVAGGLIVLDRDVLHEIEAVEESALLFLGTEKQLR
jgi:quercetin dioxygenase-like cupin family protein